MREMENRRETVRPGRFVAVDLEQCHVRDATTTKMSVGGRFSASPSPPPTLWLGGGLSRQFILECKCIHHIPLSILIPVYVWMRWPESKWISTNYDASQGQTCEFHVGLGLDYLICLTSNISSIERFRILNTCIKHPQLTDTDNLLCWKLHRVGQQFSLVGEKSNWLLSVRIRGNAYFS